MIDRYSTALYLLKPIQDSLSSNIQNEMTTNSLFAPTSTDCVLSPSKNSTANAGKEVKSEQSDYITILSAETGHCIALKSRDFLNYKTLRNIVSDEATNKTVTNFKSKVVEAVSLAEKPGDKWQQALDYATERTAALISDVINANSKYHPIEKLKTNISDDKAIDFANVCIASANRDSESSSYYAEMNLVYDHRYSELLQYVHREESGQYKVSAFQIRTEDGKLISEMKDNGHYVTYNEDGSVLKELNRSDFCAETKNICRFARYAALVYRDDADFQYY